VYIFPVCVSVCYGVSLDVLTLLVGFLSVHVLFLVLNCFDYLDLTPAWLTTFWIAPLNLPAIGFTVILCVILTVVAGIRWRKVLKCIFPKILISRRLR